MGVGKRRGRFREREIEGLKWEREREIEGLKWERVEEVGRRGS